MEQPKLDFKEIIMVDDNSDPNEKEFFYRNVKFGKISDSIGLPFKVT
jgi:hypothetical protein